MAAPSVRKQSSWPVRLVLRGWGDDERRSTRMLWELARRHWKPATLAVIGNLAAGLFAFVTAPIFALAVQAFLGQSEVTFTQALGSTGAIADKVFGTLGQGTIFFILVGLAAGAEVLRNGMTFASGAASAYLQANVFKDVWGKIFDQLMAMSFARSSKYQTGDLNQYVWDANIMYSAFQQINLLIGNVVLAIGYIAAMLWLSWQMSLISMGAVIVLTVFVLPVVRRVREAGEAHLPARVEMGNRSLEFLSGLRLLHIFSRQDFARKQMRASVEEAMKQTKRRTVWQALIQPAMHALAVIAAAAFLIGGYSVTGIEERAKLVAFIFVLYRMLPLIGNINAERAALSGNFPIVRRVTNMLRTDDKEFLERGTRPFEGLRSGIEFKAVSLQYVEGERPAVHDISFTLPRGGMVALVGESGAGKSTVADLLLGLYTPDSGEVLVDGVPLGEYELAQWRNKIGVVSQGTFLFHASVRDNIAFGRLDASDDEIQSAAKGAHADEFIRQLAQGYDTIVGDRGYRLSGGQRQRVAIARAIVRRPEMLVLDEATSDLDSRSERIIQGALNELRSNRTVLAVAHRLSTIAMADQILVMEKGRIVEQGNHHELVKLNGVYARMWQLQTTSKPTDESSSLELGN